MRMSSKLNQVQGNPWHATERRGKTGEGHALFSCAAGLSCWSSLVFVPHMCLRQVAQDMSALFAALMLLLSRVRLHTLQPYIPSALLQLCVHIM